MNRSGPSLLANLSSRSTVLSPDRGRVVTFDREGRLVYYFRNGETFKRSLGSDVHLRFQKGTRQRRQLSAKEALSLFRETQALARELAGVTTGEAHRRVVEEVLPWTAELLATESERFRRTYKPITILPPDQYLAIVLQATEGCSWNGCTFCNFYMNRPFKVRSNRDFAHHADSVKSLLGQGVRLRRGIFLADGNALALSNRRLDPMLDIAQNCFPGRDLFGFVDLYSGDRRSVEEWRHLSRRRLKRVYVGMETGLDELLHFVNKPGSARELEQFVKLLKAADLQVSLIVMVGMGGDGFRERHRSATEEVLLSLPLDQGDLVYLSPFVEHVDGAYVERRCKAGLKPMSERDVETELNDMARSLRRANLRVSRYDIREFVY